MYCYIFIYYFRRVVLENRQEGLNVCFRVTLYFCAEVVSLIQSPLHCQKLLTLEKTDHFSPKLCMPFFYTQNPANNFCSPVHEVSEVY